MSNSSVPASQPAIGIDLGAKSSLVCVNQGEKIVREFKVVSTPEAFRAAFEPLERCPVVMEVCGVSPWVSRLLEEMKFEVFVCQATVLKDTIAPRRKNDRDDARALAKLCAGHRDLLRRVRHRPEPMQKIVAMLRQRDALVKARTLLVNTVRGVLRSLGSQRPACKTTAFPERVRNGLPEDRLELVSTVVDQIVSLNAAILDIETRLTAAAKEYPAVKLLQQVQGVGVITSIAFAMVIQDPARFSNTRSVGNYLGLTPKQKQSGDLDPQLRISKAGNGFVRRLLVQCSQYILGPFAADSDLRRFGQEMAKRGGPRAKKRAVVAVARRLAVLLLSLWKTGEEYEPLRQLRLRQEREGRVTA